MQEPWKRLLTVVGMAFAILLMIAWGKFYWKRRLNRWANERGYLLIEYQGAAFYEGPGALFRSENQSAFRVKVRKSDGQISYGWLVFGRFWNPFCPGELLEEKWD